MFQLYNKSSKSYWKIVPSLKSMKNLWSSKMEYWKTSRKFTWTLPSDVEVEKIVSFHYKLRFFRVKLMIYGVNPPCFPNFGEFNHHLVPHPSLGQGTTSSLALAAEPMAAETAPKLPDRKTRRKQSWTFFLIFLGITVTYCYCLYIHIMYIHIICSSILAVDLFIWRWDIQRIDLTFWGNWRFFMSFPDATWPHKTQAELNSGQAIILPARLRRPIPKNRGSLIAISPNWR